MFSPLEPFKLERYFAQHEFSAQMLLCTSDCESMTIDELCDLDRKHGGDGGQLGSTWLGYTESRGNPVLREAISKLYTDMTPDSVLLHSGAEEAILNFYLAMIRPGQTVIVNTPCYQSLREIPRALGATVLPWELRLDGAELRWALDMAELGSLLGSAGHNPLVVLNMPHNPTGALLSRDEFEELVRLCRLYGATLFMDEVYRNLEFDEADRLPAACEAYEKAVSLSVLSKAWGLAGLRIGWLASKDTETLAKVAAVKDYNSICASAPSEALALLAICQTHPIIEANRKRCAKNRLAFSDFFAKHCELFGWIPPVAGSVAFPRLKSKMSADDLAAELLRDTGVLLLPGSNYSYDPAFFRIGLGRNNVPAALWIFDEWITENEPRYLAGVLA